MARRRSMRSELYRTAARERAELALGERAWLMVDAIESYARAVEDEMRLRDAWEDLGCKPTTPGGGSIVAHPLIGAIGKAADRREKRAQVVGLGGVKSNAGRQQGRVSAPDRKSEPPRLVRLVKMPPQD